MATLLDVGAADLNLILAHEEKFKLLRWQSAGALGVDARGHLIWGGSYQWNRQNFAEDGAREYCAKSPGDNCRIVVINGEFRAAEFLAAARLLGAQPVAAVRDAYLQGLRRPAVETTARAGGPMGPPAYGFAPLRE